MSTSRPSDNGTRLVGLEQSLQRLGGSMALFQEFAQIFKEDAPAMMEEVSQGILAGDAERIERTAHALRGLSSNFGAVAFVKELRIIEMAGKENDLSHLSDRLPGLYQLYNQLCRELAEYE